ncbi:hypothetical protein ACIBAC_29070 [Streptomyces sp. NPDC051362]|uniref:hypothetical protein n=1 Tax=Streptomyces sp. NPDC051362 TaxID=3365651 RepID=UPI00379CC9B6
MAAPWPPSELFGLWVRFGDWGAPAAARFTCRHGCLYEARGAAKVKDLTHSIAETHAQECLGVRRDDRPTRGRS